MQYKFMCPKCGQKYVLSIPIREYTSTGHKCQNPDCDGELQREVSDFASGVIWKCHGAFGKSE
uniref:Uncharacterized protein n=1 Tax=Siphoviridae sp. ctJLl6 TaxID=2827836 RepID=A0A8S5SBB1_9CAUD|nr:MAG TPA: hypothetical protein [Siphoviridae sp. ctJLl6]